MQVAEKEGIPPVRSLMLEFPEDETAIKINDQFMLGGRIMMAPIFKKGQTERDVYFPAGKWVHRITGEKYNYPKGGWAKKEKAPIGTPLVFVKVDGEYDEEM